MKRSLLVTLDYPPNVGGVANYYYNLIKNLPAEKIKVLTNQKKELISSFPILPWLKSYFKIKKIIKEKKVELLLIGQILPLGTAAWLLSKINNIPYIVFTHAMDITYPQNYWRKKFLMRHILNSAKKIITVSRYTKYEILKLISIEQQKKIEIIAPAPNITPELFPQQNISLLKQKFLGYKIVLYVGRLVERKGCDKVLQALPELIKKKIKFKYVIIGDGPEKDKLNEIVDTLKLRDYVIFKHNLTDQELARYYQLCDVFIMPSRETEKKDVEGFGLVYLEANSFGKPVIGGKSGGVQDAILDGKNGFLVEPLDVDMITKALLDLLTKKELAEKLGNFGQQRVLKEFNWSNKSKQLANLLS